MEKQEEIMTPQQAKEFLDTITARLEQKLFEVTLNVPESGNPDMAIFLPAEDETKARAAALEIMKRPVDAGYVVTGAQKIEFAMVADIHDRMYEPIVA